MAKESLSSLIYVGSRKVQKGRDLFSSLFQFLYCKHFYFQKYDICGLKNIRRSKEFLLMSGIFHVEILKLNSSVITEKEYRQSYFQMRFYSINFKKEGQNLAR